jgi:hypothetical protein
MAHARKQIRNAIAEILKGLQTTGQNVYPSRVYSLEDSELPSLSIFTIDAAGEEVVTRITLGPNPRIHRACPLIIEGHAAVDENIDDVLDRISLEVEIAMSAPIVIGSKTVPAQFQSTGKDLIGDNESQIGIVRLTYLVSYVTAENTPHILE